jgi:outer membrane receptor protein involved in Fe transport
VTIVRRPISALILTLLLSLLSASPALAQATGTLTGLLTDASGSTLPGVAIEILSEATAQTRSAITGEDGFYTVPLVTPGRYEIAATLSGFKTAKRQGVVVSVNNTTRVDLQLEVGQVSESVTVTVQAPLVETAHATMGVVIDQAKVVDLPLNGRNFTQLGNATGGFNVNGMRNQSNNFLLDGASNNDTFNTGFVLRPPPDAIQEFKIMTHSYGAEYGRNAGSVVNVVTRGGSNQWHGAAWEFNRDDRFEARNYFALTKPELKQNQYGGSLGGPLVRNRLFAFGYYEGYKNTRGTTDTRPVLSPAQRGGDFSGGAAIRDPLTGQPFAGNVIPTNRINPVAAQLLSEFIPAPNTTANRYTQSPNVEDDRHQLGFRGDFRHTDRHQILGRVLYSKTEQVNPLGGSNFSPAGNVATATLSDFMGSDTFMLTGNMINVARVAFNRIDANPNVTSGLDPRDFGWGITPSNPQALGLPNITINGFFSLGDAQQPFAHRVNEVFSLTDDFSWVAGRHSLKFGFEARRDHIVLAYINRPNGNFTFNGQYTGNAAADFLLGFPQQYRQATGDPNMDGSTFSTSLYAQDEWRVSPRLTLNAGLRYELSSPFVEKDDKLNAFYPGQQSTRFPAAPTGLVYPGDAGVPRGTYETDKNNLAPRFGLAWDPRGNGRTSVRAAWGLFYDTLAAQGDFFQNGTLAPPFQPLTEVNYSLVSTTPAFTNPLQGVAGGADFPPGLIFIGWGRDFETPVVQHYNLTVQQQLGDRLGLEVGYVGSRGKNLPIFMEINPTTPVLSPTPRQGARLYPAFSLVRPTFSEARSWYDSLQASARLLPWRRMNFLASYTWSHAIDHLSGLNIGGESRPMLPVTIGDQASIDRALEREKGDALFDARHRVVFSFGYELPTLDTNGPLLKYTLGGWQVNGIVQAQSGFALTVTESVDVALQSLTNRPNAVCDPNANAPNTPEQWFDTSCFTRLTLAANAGQIGDTGRGTVRGPGFARTDLSLFKNFDFPGRQRIQVRIEAFNLFDQTRFGNPGLSVGTPTAFGVITSADDGRIVQLGVKYQF